MSASVGLERVLEPAGVLPQAAWRLDARPEIAADEVRIAVERLNLDAASFRQLAGKHGGDGDAVRAEVLEIVAARGKMHNPVTGSGGMLIGVVEEAGPQSPLGLKAGDRVATLVSLTLTPLRITDGLARWDGRSEQVPAEGTAILFGRSVAAVLPDDLAPELALAVYDVCGAPALTDRVVREYDRPVTVAVLGGAGKSGSLSLAAARLAGARTVAVVVSAKEAEIVRNAATADEVRVADARNPVAVSRAVTGCEHGAILATAAGGTVIFFSMATSFPAAALGAEGLAADVTMLIGNGYLPGHAEFAVDVLRRVPAVRRLFEERVAGH
jgi:L-erythro-3,5-diaminohexanoate dehydrogenase